MLLACALCACGKPVLVTRAALPCSQLVASQLADDVPGADLPPDGATVADWITFGDAQTGQLDKSNANRRAALDVMVKALLAGRKTQTRRLASSPLRRVQVGDRLWVKESWFIATRYSYGTTPGGDDLPPPPLASRKGDPVHYTADGNPPNCANRHYGPEGLRGGWFAAPDPYAVWNRRPSIHMTRWASRLTLVVTERRIEKLRDISPLAAKAEGLEPGYVGGIIPAYRGSAHLEWRIYPDDAYGDLWDSLHKAEGQRWQDNPEVLALTFAVRRGNIDG